jgi:hypothetical protein
MGPVMSLKTLIMSRNRVASVVSVRGIVYALNQIYEIHLHHEKARIEV